MTTGKTNIALTRWTFFGKVMSLLFNMLSRLIIAFLPRNTFFEYLHSFSTNFYIRLQIFVMQNNLAFFWFISLSSGACPGAVFLLAKQFVGFISKRRIKIFFSSYIWIDNQVFWKVFTSVCVQMNSHWQHWFIFPWFSSLFSNGALLLLQISPFIVQSLLCCWYIKV